MIFTVLERISVVVFLTLVNFWFLMTCGADAAIWQHLLYKTLMILRPFSTNSVNACIFNFQNHLWYTCQEMTPLAIASTLISDEERTQLARVWLNLCLLKRVRHHMYGDYNLMEEEHRI